MVTETMKAVRTEYRVEHLPVQDHPEAHLAEILDRLNDFGKDGWRVASVDLTWRPEVKPAAEPPAPLPVLLERPVGWQRPVEYRIERIPFQDHPEAHWEILLERLTELERDGWTVMAVDLTYHPAHYKPGSPWALYGLDSKYTLPLDIDLVKEAEVQVKADPVPVVLGREV
jgi:hypothetical protein